MAKFFLRTKKEEGQATLYISIQKRVPKVSLRFVATGISVDIETWNKANRNINAWRKFEATNEGINLTKKMDLVTQTIDRLFAEGRISGNDDKFVIEKALHDISTAEAIKFKEEQRKRKKEQQAEREHSIIGFYEYFFKGISDGTIRHSNGKTYTDSTIVVWKYFGAYLKEYCSRKVQFDDISKPFADKFSVYLEKKGLMPGTINKQVNCFRKLCNLAAEEGLNSNAVSLKVWKERTIKASDKRTEVYLTDKELDALYQMELSPERSKVRDIFFIGYLSGQRFSDYSDFTADNFKKVDGGVDVIGLTQKKTGNYVEIPIWDDRVIEIAKRYNYAFPKMDSQKLNHDIKDILCELSASVPSLAEKYITVLSMPERRSEALYQSFLDRLKKGGRLNYNEHREYAKMRRYADSHDGSPLYERNGRNQVIRPKYELVSSHTARRSSITNLYKSGLLDNREIMSISGHQSERVFESYIKVGTSEQAQRVGKKLMKAKAIPLKQEA
ncbi:MAG: phage integrase SAM-like domain-containing protein [Prevotella sp.]|nr:phage integrase SAM-like domain-containing protein [Prevotella sp.]